MSPPASDLDGRQPVLTTKPYPDTIRSSAAHSEPLPRLAGEEYFPIEAWDSAALTMAPATLSRFGEGDVLFGPGDILSHAYRIVAGRVNMVLEGPSGRDTVIATAGPGTFVGEAFVLTRKPSLLWAVAATAVVVAVYDATDLLGPSGNLPSLPPRRPCFPWPASSRP
jgi:hypothetical protein